MVERLVTRGVGAHASALEALVLPLDDATRQQEGKGRFELSLPDHDLAMQAVSTVSQAHGLPAAACILAAWATVLSRLSAQQYFEIDVLTPARAAATALAVDLRDDMTSGELARQFDIGLARTEPSGSSTPASQAAFVVCPTQVSNDKETLSSAIVLKLSTDADHGPAVRLSIAEGALSDAAAQRWAGYLSATLRAFAAQPGSAIATLPMIGAAEQALIASFNATQSPWPEDMLVHQMVEAQAARTSEAIALLHGDRQLSYQGLERRAHALALRLRAAGIAPDAPVGIYLERSIEMVVALLAVLKAGGAYVPLDPSHPEERINVILEEARPTVVLSQAELCGALPSGTRVMQVDDLADDDSAASLPVLSTPENLAYVIFTSGSTGKPKGVAMPHRGLVNLLHWQRANPAVAHPQRTLQFSALGFDVAFQDIFATLTAGGTLILIDEAVRRDPAALVSVMKAQRVERIFLPFIALQNLCEHVVASGDLLPELQDVMTAGEQLHASPAVRAFFERHAGARLHNQYGPTESHVVTALELPRAPHSWQALPSIGRPIANCRIHILDARGQAVPLGAVGEIYIGGLGVAHGYLCRPQLTDERFVADRFTGNSQARLYKTGDLGRWRPDGQIDYLGRNDDQVKVRGFRVELGEIEGALMSHDAVREAAVVARQDAFGNTRLLAYVTPQPDRAPTPDALRAHLKATLPPYMVPALFMVLDTLPRSTNGKIDRRALPEPLAQRPEMAVPYEEGRLADERLVCKAFASALAIDRVGRNDNFFELGGDSLLVARVLADLQQETGRPLSSNLFFDNPTPAAIARALEEKAAEPIRQEQLRRDTTTEEPIALVGMAGRFPGASDVEQFWDNLIAGRDTIRFFDEAALDRGISAALRSDPSYVRARGVLDDVAGFDAAFFGINPKEATLMDPQQRVFLELCWECMERAGYAPDQQTRPVGVYAGMHNATYFQRHVMPRPDLVDAVGEFAVMLGNEKDYIATRVANRLNLTGPALALNTACSTSLVAIAQAFHALRGGHCDMALAGGVAITCPPNSGYLYLEGAMLSPDGRTRSFDADAQGTVFSDGAAVVMLKRLSDAQAEGDTIYAVLRGVGVNNDGGAKASFTAPSIEGQANAIAAALENAGVSARTISYVEAHGTATPMGDPVEIAALARAFGRHTGDNQFCAIGSVKSNVGHTLMAAGATGLIKTAMALHEQRLPASLHFSSANPAIDFAATPFHVNDALTHWPRSNGTPRRAGVSSFGVGGTNAHVIVEEAPVAIPTDSVAGPHLLTLSAKSATALAAARTRLADHLESHPSASLDDVAHTLRVGRTAFSHRCAWVAGSPAEAAAILRANDSAALAAGSTPAWVPDPVFVFPGQGAQYPGMGKQLYASGRAVKAAFDECLRAFEGLLPFDLRERMFSPDPAALAPTSVTQPATFVLEYSLAREWLTLGRQPAALIGHSVGEFAAAVLAGVMSLPDAAMLVARRGALMQACPPGSMLSVRMGADAMASRLPAGVSLAADNSPSNCVCAGPSDAIEQLRATLEDEGIGAKALQTSHAFHSSMMDEAVAPFETLVRTVKLHAPTTPIFSTLTGRLLSADEATDPHYWAQHLRQTVRFSAAVRSALAEIAHPCFVEIGPRATLSTLVRQHATKAQPAVVCPLLADTPDQEVAALRLAAGRAWIMGLSVDLNALDSRARKQRVLLPTYPFERKRFWVDTAAPMASAVERPNTLSLLASTAPSEQNMPAANQTDPSRIATLQARLRDLFEDISGTDLAAAEGSTPFVEMGLDSLTLTQAAIQVKRIFKVNLSFRQLMESYRTFDALVGFLDATLPPEPVSAPVAGPATATPNAEVQVSMPVAMNAPVAALPPLTLPANASLTHQVIAQQMALMQQQLVLLGSHPVATTSPPLATSTQAAPTPVAEAARQAEPAAPSDSQAEQGRQEPVKYDVKKAFGAIARIHTQSRAPTERQKARLAAFIRRYTERTRKSKAFTETHRPHMADPRVVNGFRPVTKEIVYQVVIERSKGSRLWDLDGNEYVDALNGFGMNMFGWQPEFVQNAVRTQLDLGYEIGPQHPLAGDVTQRICQLTGFDRAALCNTGSEAVMAAVRIARTSTGRNTVVLFSGSYHGTFDEVLVRAGREAKGAPAAPGIMNCMFGEVRVLDYGTPESLEFIRKNAHDLAAVLVEPVQSRRPDFQPKEFLREVRAITQEAGTCLIFDEVITGFRSHVGGAQALFDIRADLGCYGKVIGGGFPIGAIAGKREFMDALDGGGWNYGDDSVPTVGVTYFAGTFVRHPIALAAAQASLKRFAEGGTALQAQLNVHTAAMADELSAFCREVGAPLEIRYFTSLWRVTWLEDHPLQDLLFAMMRSRGVHILDNFPCFMTTAHTQEDIALIKSAFKESVAEMQEAEFLPRNVVPSTTSVMDASRPPLPNARLGRDKDGQPAWFVPDPQAPGKFKPVKAQAA